MRIARIRSYNSDDETERMLHALCQGHSVNHSELIRFLIRKEWAAQFDPEKKTKKQRAQAVYTLHAVQKALLNVMPASRSEAKTQLELLRLAGISSLNTGKNVINALLMNKDIERIGSGGISFPFRYFTRKRASGATVRKNLRA